MKIKVLLVMPNREPQAVKIPRSMKFIKALIGEEILKVKLNENTIIIANQNADVTEFNRLIGKDKIILGTFIVVSIKNKRRVTMTKKQIRKYTNMFKLKKHQNKIRQYKEKCLEDYYSIQKEIKQKNAVANRKFIFKTAA